MQINLNWGPTVMPLRPIQALQLCLGNFITDSQIEPSNFMERNIIAEH